jgi:hypothetical protein
VRITLDAVLVTTGTKSSLIDLETIAGEVFAALGAGWPISSFSDRFPAFDLEGAYQVGRSSQGPAGRPRRIASGSQDRVYESDDLGGVRRLRADLGICLQPYGAPPSRRSERLVL